MLENPLHKYASYNYRWKFGLIGPANIHNPSVYRSNGPDLTIIQSGGFPDKSLKTYSEEALGVNVEYFIDDFNSNYLVVPNPGTSFSNAITLDFKVYEPLSVGLFFQTLRLASDQLYGSQRGYLNIPFCLQLDFVGYDDNGNSYVEPAHTLAIKLINVTFNVDQSGSVYHVSAIPWNHQAYMDQIQAMRTDTVLSGDTVYSMLAGDQERSLVSELNRQEQVKVEQGIVQTPNKYTIEFPTDPGIWFSGIVAPRLNSNQIVDPNSEIPAVYSTSEDAQDDRDRQRQALRETVDTPAGPQQVSVGVRVQQEQARLASGGNVNYIGQSAIVTDFSQYGNNPFGVESFIFDEGDDQTQGDEVYRRGTLSIDANNREFTFRTGTKIEKMISQIILSSDWGLDLINQQPDNGMVTWFKIHSEVNILDVNEVKNSGECAYEFVYKVSPYKVSASVISPTWQDQDYTPQVQNAVKSYYYTYTGLNSDIINFEFTIDNSFYKELANNTTQARQDSMHGSGSGITTTGPVDTFVPNAGSNDGRSSTDGGSTSRVVAASNDNPANAASTSRRDVANTFQRAILNSDTDNIVLDLKIWGDPYYFMDSDVGNFIAPSGGNPNVTNDNRIDPSRNEVYVLIHFKTGVDYNGNLIQIDPVNSFSGVYRVITFQNNFTNGMFTQVLNLARMPNQSISSVESSNSVVEANISGNLPLVLGNLVSEAAARSTEFQTLLRQAQEFENLATAFRAQGIDNFANILSGTQINELFQNLQGAFSQVARIQSTLNNTLGLLQGGLGNAVQTIAGNAIQNAINRSPIGGAINNINRIRSDVNDIRTNLRNIGRR